MKKLTIGIVGGSIAGCSAAIRLRREGHEAQVFERSRGGLVGRGGGIGTPGPVLDALIAEDILDADFPYLSGKEMPFIIRTPTQERLGYSPWQMPLNLSTFHWSTLWGNLRKRVSENAYHMGHWVIDAKAQNANTVTLKFKDGSTADFDLVIFADGYSSLGRELIYPDANLVYRGYMLWRGLLPEQELDDSAPLEDNMPRLSYTDIPGNLVMYYVPGQDGSIQTGHRVVNWAAYIPIPEKQLSQFMIDRDGNARTGTIPPGMMQLGNEEDLKRLMRDNLPSYYGDIIAKTQDTYVQLIYTVRMPAYHRGRICLIGDAGAVAQPFTGSGVFKGNNNIQDLNRALKSHDTLEEALHDWDREQVQIGNRLLALGDQMEQAFIWNSLDLASADAATTTAWWKEAVTFPDDFTYAREED